MTREAPIPSLSPLSQPLYEAFPEHCPQAPPSKKSRGGLFCGPGLRAFEASLSFLTIFPSFPSAREQGLSDPCRLLHRDLQCWVLHNTVPTPGWPSSSGAWTGPCPLADRALRTLGNPEVLQISFASQGPGQTHRPKCEHLRGGS